MYIRNETITSVNDTFVRFIDTLDTNQISIFLDLLNSNLSKNAISYTGTQEGNTLVITSVWESKEEYTDLLIITELLVKEALGITAVEYYSDITKFSVELIEETV